MSTKRKAARRESGSIEDLRSALEGVSRKRPRRGLRGIPRGMYLQNHMYKQTYHPSATALTVGTNATYDATTGFLSGPSTTASGNGYFTLEAIMADLPQVSSFAGLYDQYRIIKWKVDFVPMLNYVGPAGFNPSNATAFIQYLNTVIDYDDAALPTTENQLLEYTSLKYTPGYAKHVRTFQPKVTLAAFQSGSFNGYTANQKGPNPYIDFANTGVNHYGIKGMISTAAVAANNIEYTWKVYCTLWIECKAVR